MAAANLKPTGKFIFRGQIPASKSLMNRALVAKSFAPSLQIEGHSACEDVKHMIHAMNLFPKATEIDCGEAGTVFRFMALRASREVGVYRLKGTRRLLERPQRDLLFVLNQLSVRAELLPDELIIESRGWVRPLAKLVINRDKSSQFSTGLLMSAWGLPYPLEFNLTPTGISDPYWNMSLEFAQELGMQIEQKEKDQFFIPPQQRVTKKSIIIEPDYSSAFSIAVAAAIFGEAHLEKFAEKSLQPDFAFIEIMRKMRIPVSWANNTLSVFRAAKISPAHIIMRDTPDLFPVLAVLCAFAEGESKLVGAPRLMYKESNRIKKTSELLNLLGVKSEMTADGIIIQGKGSDLKPTAFEFDPDQDHRMAMAAGILMRGGWPIQLKTPEIVKKSFPEFWQIMGFQP